jgi:ADP-ribosyl-[dinitrogen reductase] hydrolase
MRAAPIGIYPTVSLVIERCRIQAALTHNTLDVSMQQSRLRS